MNYYQENHAAFLEGLKAWLRIPSISTLSEHKPGAPPNSPSANCAPRGSRATSRRRRQSAGSYGVHRRARRPDAADVRPERCAALIALFPWAILVLPP